jgi:hypothetical protein
VRAGFGRLAVWGWILCTLALAACASYRPGSPEPMPFLERAQTRTDRGITASAAVLVGPESEAYFGTDLAAHQVQPVWVRIENREDVPYRFAPRAFDPYYFSPGEVADLSGFLLSAEGRAALENYLRQQLVPEFIEARSIVSGLVYAPINYGAKAATVMLIGDNAARQLEFVMPVPNLDADWMTVSMAELYRPDRLKTIAAGDETVLRAAARGPSLLRRQCGRDPPAGRSFELRHDRPLRHGDGGSGPRRLGRDRDARHRFRL